MECLESIWLEYCPAEGKGNPRLFDAAVLTNFQQMNIRWVDGKLKR